jgi:hypothetical protein
MIMKLAAATGIIAFGMLAGTAPAIAGTHPGGGNYTSGDGSILGGNQIIAPTSTAFNFCGNAIAIFGIAGAGCHGGAFVK